MSEHVRLRARRARRRARPGGSTSTVTASPSCASTTTSTPSATAARHADISLSEGEVHCDDARDRVLEARQHASRSRPASRSRCRPPGRCPCTTSRVDGDDVVRGDRDRRAERARDRGPARRRRRARRSCRASTSSCAAARCTRSWARTARASRRCRTCSWAGPATRSPAGSVTLDGVDLLALPTVGAGPGRAVPRHAVPDRGAGRGARRRARARRCVAAGRDHRRSSRERMLDEAERIGFDERFLDRPLNVDLSGGEKKRNETLQLGVLAPEDRHPRRARLRPRRRRAAGRAAAASRRPPTSTASACWPSPTTAGCSTSCGPTTSTSSSAGGSSARAARSWRCSSKVPVTPISAPMTTTIQTHGDPLADVPGDPLPRRADLSSRPMRVRIGIACVVAALAIVAGVVLWPRGGKAATRVEAASRPPRPHDHGRDDDHDEAAAPVRSSRCRRARGQPVRRARRDRADRVDAQSDRRARTARVPREGARSCRVGCRCRSRSGRTRPLAWIHAGGRRCFVVSTTGS